MLQADNEKVFIEYCQRCPTHSWCTKHDESKYNSYFESVRSKLREICPEVEIIGNQIPLAFSSKFSSHEDSRPWEGTLSFPRIGAFEVYFKERVLFSKLETGLWPHPGAIANKVREIIDRPKLPPVGRENNKTLNLMKKKRNAVGNRKVIARSIQPSSSRSDANRVKSTTPKRKIGDFHELGSFKKIDQDRSVVEHKVRKRKDEEEYSDDFKEESEENERDNVGEKEVTKVYELKLSAEKLSNKVKIM
jgi:hypothetical protein